MRIPKQAKKVFTGEIFNVWQWPQKMFDGSIETFEMLDRDDTIEVIPIINDKIILLQEEQPTLSARYGIVGGRNDQKETALECAKRELLEETGLISNDWELIKEFYPYHKMDWKISRYVARNCKKVAEQKLDPGEKIEIKPVNFTEFIEIISQEDFRSQDVTLDILKMKHFNQLEEFKQKLFKK